MRRWRLPSCAATGNAPPRWPAKRPRTSRCRSTRVHRRRGSWPPPPPGAAGAARRWPAALARIDPLARAAREDGFVGDRVGRVPMRWLAGELCEHLGQPDSATAWFERVLGVDRLEWHERLPVAFATPGARIQL